MSKHLDFARPRTVVGWAVLAGVVAGLCAAGYHSIVSEPLVDEAIAIEDATAAATADSADSAADADSGHPAGDEHADDSVEVSRSTQRGAGLFAAYGMLGAAYALILAVAALSLRGAWLEPFRRVLVAGTILTGALTVVPWFKYPPNPPAVGDPSTAAERQRLYWLLVVLAGVVLAGAAHLSGRLRTARWDDARRIAAVGVATVLVLGVVLAVLPPNSDPIPTAVPATLIWRFRVASLTGNLLLWGLLTVGFGGLWAEASRRVGAGADAPAHPAGSATVPSPPAGPIEGQNSIPFMAEIPSS